MSDSESNVVVVTGAGGGLGSGIVSGLLDDGYRIVASDANEGQLNKLLEKHTENAGSALLGIVADVSSEKDWGKIRDQAKEHFCVYPMGLINNAGTSPKHHGKKRKGVAISLDEWNGVVDVNLTGAFLGIKTLAPPMIDAGMGRVINISSVAARFGGRVSGVHYAATKTGLLGITRAFARELASSGITVNALALGRIAAGMVDQVSDEINKNYQDLTIVGRLGTVNDVVHSVKYLLDEHASFITGATMDVNGGTHMQ